MLTKDQIEEWYKDGETRVPKKTKKKKPYTVVYRNGLLFQDLGVHGHYETLEVAEKVVQLMNKKDKWFEYSLKETERE
jgi:hypothetical protein